MTLYWENEFGQLYLGKAEDILPNLPLDLVDMTFTSPPYWMARKYLADDELGQESDYRDYITNLCNIFAEVKRVTKPTGSLFVNIGDKYFSRSVGSGGKNLKQNTNPDSFFTPKQRIVPLMPDGSLMNIPSRFSIKMIDDYNWIQKHLIIWYKRNAFTTSNKKKFTIDFEPILHFVLNTKMYYFQQQFEPSNQKTQERLRNILRQDKDNLKEPYKDNAPRASRYKHNQRRITSQESPNRVWEDKESLQRMLDRGRNKRSVWDIPTGSNRNASNHIAMFPEKLPEVPILACCPENFGVVLDPFIGSGTVAVVAEKLGRRWIGIEASEEYCEQAVERISKC